MKAVVDTVVFFRADPLQQNLEHFSPILDSIRLNFLRFILIFSCFLFALAGNFTYSVLNSSLDFHLLLNSDGGKYITDEYGITWL